MNNIRLIGEVTKDCEFSHQRYGIDFYSIMIRIVRESGAVDNIPIILSWYQKFNLGDRIEIFGSIRTVNICEEDKRKLKVFVFADDIGYTNDRFENDAFIFGSICRRNPIRETPNGKIILDAILAINRPYNKSDYIPCVFWGSDAYMVEQMQIGDELEASGRLQSRIYEKDGNKYEVVELSIRQIA